MSDTRQSGQIQLRIQVPVDMIQHLIHAPHVFRTAHL